MQDFCFFNTLGKTFAIVGMFTLCNSPETTAERFMFCATKVNTPGGLHSSFVVFYFVFVLGCPLM